jgi:MoaA/NifB/PqqE/SkfB family radical SAM enzyme
MYKTTINSVLAKMNNKLLTIAKDTFLEPYIRHLKLKKSLKNKKRFLNISMDTNNTCNLKCIMCPRPHYKIAPIHMKTEEFQLIADKCFAYTKKLDISCAYEPTISKNIIQILRIVHDFHIPQVMMVTNGVKMSDELIEGILLSVDELQFSIGEAKAETYRKLRGPFFAQTIENIKRLKKRDTRGKLKLVANLTLMKENAGELADFCKMAKEIGLHRVQGRPLMILKGMEALDRTFLDNTEHINNIIRHAAAFCKKNDLEFFMEEIRNKSNDIQYCQHPWFNLYIYPDGKFSICPRLIIKQPVGDILSGSFADNFIYHKKAAKLRKEFFTFKKMYLNKRKDQGNEKNRMLNSSELNDICQWCMNNERSHKEIDFGF